MTTYVIDTNALLDNPIVKGKEKYIVYPTVLRELETLEKRKGDSTLQFSIRKAKRFIRENSEQVTIPSEVSPKELGNILYYNNLGDPNYADNQILANALHTYEKMGETDPKEKLVILTNDILMQLKAKGLGLEVEEHIDQQDIGYTGVKDFYYSNSNEEHQETLSKIETLMNTDYYHNPFDMKPNEYLAVWDKDDPHTKDGELRGYNNIGMFRFDGTNLKRVPYHSISNKHFGKIKPLNTRQNLAMDMLKNEDITVKVLSGTWGAGKDALMIAQAVGLIDSGKFDKIVWVRNNIEVDGTNPIGFLPDTVENKLLPYLGPLQDHLGGEEALYQFMDAGKIEVMHLGFARGRDIKNSIIYVTEGQNLSKGHIQLLLSRVGEGSQLWVNGDMGQSDSNKFKRYNAIQALNKLAGEPLYGQVDLDLTERSETARLAAKLDD